MFVLAGFAFRKENVSVKCMSIVFARVAYYFNSKCTDMSNFHPLEVAGRGSDTQLQVRENLNYYNLSL